MTEVVTRAAATVIVGRDGPSGIEVLMIRRDQGMKFMGGYWVFPGGALEPSDAVEGGDDLHAARVAGARETREEVGLQIDPANLAAWSHWEPPPDVTKRFATWFFVTPAPPGNVVIDDVEARAYAWWQPETVLAARDRSEVELAPPTWVTLWELLRYSSMEQLLAAAATREPEYFVTKIAPHDIGPVAMWFGDAGYATNDATIEGPRHRLWMDERAWRYERD
ncbi:MAG: NUDIX hydrolase [Acidimicrobiia bacterium]